MGFSWCAASMYNPTEYGFEILPAGSLGILRTADRIGGPQWLVSDMVCLFCVMMGWLRWLAVLCWLSVCFTIADGVKFQRY